MPLPIQGFYPIIDVGPGTDPTAPLDLARAVLDAGARILQLRAKGLPSRLHLELARRLVETARTRGGSVVVNDRVDLALLAGAAAVHLGDSDLPIDAARTLAGDRLAIGLSTHSAEEAAEADRLGADYIGFGPMFRTDSKADALEPRTLDSLRAARRATRLPIVAIGGIDETSAPAVRDAGADAIAMIGALRSAPDPAALTRRLLAL